MAADEDAYKLFQEDLVRFLKSFEDFLANPHVSDDDKRRVAGAVDDAIQQTAALRGP